MKTPLRDSWPLSDQLLLKIALKQEAQQDEIDYNGRYANLRLEDLFLVTEYMYFEKTNDTLCFCGTNKHGASRLGIYHAKKSKPEYLIIQPKNKNFYIQPGG